MSTPVPGPYDSVDEFYAEPPVESGRSRSVALVLGILGGVFGLHRFYAGRTHSGVAMVLTLGGLGIWWLYDMIVLVAGEFRDADGRPIRNWGVEEAQAAHGAGAREIQQLREELDQAQGQLAELAERMDFAERMLAQQRERTRLAP